MSATYHLRRKDKEISAPEEVLGILERGKYTCIAMCRDNEPYIVTLSYGFDPEERALYCHCAQEGLKIAFLESNPRVCGTVIEDTGYRMGQCEQGYRSVVYRAEMSVVTDIETKRYGLGVLLDHLEEDSSRLKSKYFSNQEALTKVCVLKLSISEATGKEDA